MANFDRLISNLICIFFPVILWCAPINWDQATSIQTGVKLQKIELPDPLIKAWIARVDLHTPGLVFTATGRDQNYGKAMPIHKDKKKRKGTIRTLRIKTVDFMKHARKMKSAGGRELNMILAVNAAPWGPWPPPDHLYADPSGINISDGILITDHPGRPVFAVLKNGTPVILPELKKEHIPKVWVAVSGFDIVMKDGKITPRGESNKRRDPRMAFGLSRDRRYMYLIAIDGRQPDWSVGASYPELFSIGKDAGAYDLINMDGGGSTSLVYFDPKRKTPVFVNRHAGGGQRHVGSNLGIFLRWPTIKQLNQQP